MAACPTEIEFIGLGRHPHNRQLHVVMDRLPKAPIGRIMIRHSEIGLRTDDRHSGSDIPSSSPVQRVPAGQEVRWFEGC